jgi:hypothetical protein
LAAPPYGLPAAIVTWVRRAGIRAASSVPVASPRAASAATVCSPTLASQLSGSSVTSLAISSWQSRRRLTAATASVHAAWTIGTVSRVTTKTVRRMPSIRTSVRSSYNACSTAATVGWASRAAAAR